MSTAPTTEAFEPVSLTSSSHRRPLQLGRWNKLNLVAMASTVIMVAVAAIAGPAMAFIPDMMPTWAPMHSPRYWALLSITILMLTGLIATVHRRGGHESVLALQPDRDTEDHHQAYSIAVTLRVLVIMAITTERVWQPVYHLFASNDGTQFRTLLTPLVTSLAVPALLGMTASLLMSWIVTTRYNQQIAQQHDDRNDLSSPAVSPVGAGTNDNEPCGTAQSASPTELDDHDLPEIWLSDEPRRADDR